MTIRISPDSCDTPNRASSSHRAISWRKILILNRGAFSRAWDVAFPKHDLGTGRLRRYSLDTFDLACDRAAAARRPRDPHLDRLRRLLKDDVSLDRACNELNDRPTPQSTVEAIMLCVRERGIAALKEPVNIERLSRCNNAARAVINRRIAKLRNCKP